MAAKRRVRESFETHVFPAPKSQQLYFRHYIPVFLADPLWKDFDRVRVTVKKLPPRKAKRLAGGG